MPSSPLPIIDEIFFQHLTDEDEMGVVLRAQIHIEASVNEFIEARLPFPEELPRLLFEARLRLSCALGLKKDYFEALKFLGDLRNRFAHKLDAKLDDSQLRQLFTKLPPDGREIVEQAYKNSMALRGGACYPSFAELSPKDRFVLISVILKSYIVAAVHEVKAS